MQNANIILIGEHTEFHDVLISAIRSKSWSCKSHSRFEEFIHENYEGSRVFLIDVDVFEPSPISSHDLAISDDGFICSYFASTYVIVYSITDDLKKVENALNLGADDFVGYPFDTEMILSKIIAFNRRYEVLKLYCKPFDNKIESGDLILDPILKHASLKDVPLDLTHSEFNILYTLYKNPDHIFSKDHLFQMVTGQKSLGDYNALMTHISRLRKKMSVIDSQREYITTVRNHGYKTKKNQESE